MQIVDAQVHIWAASTPERPWPQGHSKPHRAQPFSKNDLLREMDAAGVSRAVLVPPSWEGKRNDLALEAARLHPNRYAVMGLIELDRPAPSGLIETWRKQPGMLGLRCGLHRPRMRPLLAEDGGEWLWTRAAAAGVPLMITAHPEQLHHIDRVASRHPQVKLVMDHMSMPSGTKDEQAFGGLDRLLALAKRPNVAVKATSLPTYTSDAYPYRRVHDHLRRVYDAFGPQRMFWGSDLTKLPCTYRQAVTLFTKELAWLTNEDKEWIMGRGLCTWLDWQP